MAVVVFDIPIIINSSWIQVEEYWEYKNQAILLKSKALEKKKKKRQMNYFLFANSNTFYDLVTIFWLPNPFCYLFALSKPSSNL